MVSPRDYLKNKVDDAFLRELLEVLETYNVPVSLETIHAALVSRGQNRMLPAKKKSALEILRRKLKDLSNKGLVVIAKELPEEDNKPRPLGSPHNTYKLHDSVLNELNDFLDIKERERGVAMVTTIRCNRIPCQCGFCKG